MTWVSPQQLREAAVRLGEAVRAGAPETRVILASYERNAKATRMTLEVNW